MRAIVLGSNGLLGSAFVSRCTDWELLTPRRDEITPPNFQSFHQAVSKINPDLIINCAADTDVERAETDHTTCLEANALLPEMVAWTCRQRNIPLVHFSSTGCYGDWKDDPFDEFDTPQPTTFHHRSKIEGENLIRASGCDHVILRTGWLFGGRPGQAKNFVWNRMAEALTKTSLHSDPFQRGNPTYVGSVVDQTVRVLSNNLRGTFNCVSGPGASRFEYVQEIISGSQLPTNVLKTDKPFQRKARVSHNETALNFKMDKYGVSTMPNWRDTLSAYIKNLLSSADWVEKRASSQNETI